MLITAIAFIVVLGVLVLFHEFGHFITAKLSGVKVLEFSIGFPPRIFSVKKGETKYTVGAFPLGGYVQMLGENEESKDKRAFNTQPPGKRFLISVAGVVMNIILAWLIFSIGFMVGMTPLATPADKLGGTVRTEVAVADVLAGSPAAQGGLTQKDVLLSANAGGQSQIFISVQSLIDFNTAHKGQSVVYLIKRNGANKEVSVNLKNTEQSQLGISIVDQTKVKVAWYKAPLAGLKETYNVTALTFKMLGQLFAKLFSTGQVSEDVGGPVKIYMYTGLAVKAGFVVFLQFIGMLSVSLALFNILPIPALDGSKMVFILLEKIAGKKVLKESVENIVHTIGFALLIILILAITYKDIVGIFFHK